MKSGIKKKLVAVIMVSIIALIFSLGFYIKNHQVKSMVISDYTVFINSLYKRDYDEAIARSLGNVKYNISVNKGSNHLNDVKINALDCYIIYKNDNLCDIYSTIEYVIDNELYLDFINAKMIKEDGVYKVYKLENTEPNYRFYKKNKNIDISSAANVFQKYVELLNDNAYKEAGTYLIGKAKMMHNSTSDILKEARLIKDPHNYAYEYLAGGSKFLKLKMNYMNDNRQINVLVSFFNTLEGWKIYDITQI